LGSGCCSGWRRSPARLPPRAPNHRQKLPARWVHSGADRFSPLRAGWCPRVLSLLDPSRLLVSPSTLASEQLGRHHGERPSLLVADWNLPLTANRRVTTTGAWSS